MSDEPSVPSDRCGYTHPVEGIADLGEACCWRPVRDGGDRCVWHTDEPVARREYDEHRPRRGERLDGAHLADAPLSGVEWLAGTVLVGADFTGAAVDGADLREADLRTATVREASARGATFDRARLQDATVEVVDLRGASFRDAELYRLHVDDVRIDRDTAFDETSVYERRLAEDPTDEAAFSAAVRVARELRALYEDSPMPERSWTYAVREYDLRRRYAWARGRYGRALYLEGSRWVMRYGTSPARILATSAALILVCALLYPLTGGIREVAGDRSITYRIEDPQAAGREYQVGVFLRSLYFSVVTFSSLGYGDIQPVGGYARLIASVETLLGTMLLALLIFVLTRRFR